MNKDLYSNRDFQSIIKRIDKEMHRRGGYRWNNPLSTPKVGSDRSLALSHDKTELIDDETYTSHNVTGGTETSADQMTYDEMIGALEGLSQIHDINLFYGKDEISGLAYRDPSDIENVLQQAELDKLNTLAEFNYTFSINKDGQLVCTYGGSDNAPKVDIDNGRLILTHTDENGHTTQDVFDLHYEDDYLVIDNKKSAFMLYATNPHDGTKAYYNVESNQFVMPSGEYDGEELDENGLGPNNFFDDYGAKPGNGDYHPYNPNVSKTACRDWNDQDDQRTNHQTVIIQGGRYSMDFGSNPRNPQIGSPYTGRPVYSGVPSTCQVACTGLCSMTCDNECSSSCTTTCWNNCGNACVSSCGNSCTGCASQCSSSCRTKCQNSEGYACVKSGAQTVLIESMGGFDGIPAKNYVSYTTYSCQGCSYSCEFYPNKKTTCWDAGCMGQCFTSCDYSCSNSCQGGCIDNKMSNNTNYRSGKGRGCSSGCTVNCIGNCTETCNGLCTLSCFAGCKQECSDNCSVECNTSCGVHCTDYCSNACTGCSNQCTGSCRDKATSHICSGCSAEGGCSSVCAFGCSSNCNNWGCAAMCGSSTEGSCVSSCRMNCSGTSCTAMCSDQCSSTCTSCVHTCGFQCGACSSLCSTGCEAECNVRCSTNCANSCDLNCVKSCTEACGGCSNLCYSCVSMCIGLCSVKCESGCTSCANQCSGWCDRNCSTVCGNNCDSMCNGDCSSSCIGGVKNRETERSSYKIIKEEFE